MSAMNFWPELPLSAWKDTYATLHMWTQIVGKIKLKLNPFVNHWWQVALYVTPRGLTSSTIPYKMRSFEIVFDFVDHTLSIRTHEGLARTLALSPKPVAEFYKELMSCLHSLGIEVQVDLMPSEVPNPIPLDQDLVHAAYDYEFATRLCQILVQTDRVMKKFRSDFIGKCSPVHFFWGSFDLAVTRFSGRTAPRRAGIDHITEVAYSHEVISCGFWPGSGNIQDPAFYAYAAPEPIGYNQGPILPPSAFYNPATKGYILRYEEVRRASDPDHMLLEFFQSTYNLGADLGRWDRSSLELKPHKGQFKAA